MGMGVWHIIVSNYKEKGYVRNHLTLPPPIEATTLDRTIML